MAAEQGAAGWHSPPCLPVDDHPSSLVSNEHLTLLDFAHRLGSSITNNESGIADERNVRQDANLLMSLLYSSAAAAQTRHMITDDVEHVSCNSSAASSSDHHYLSDASTSSSSYRRDSFRFSCPSLSLDCDSFMTSQRLKTPCTAPRGDRDSDDSDYQKNKTSPPPAILLGRALKLDDRDALRLSADAMARNLLLSFQKALEWRIESWIGALSASLVRKERGLMRQQASEGEVRKLLQTSEAQLILRLREVAQKINVQNAETCFRILPQRLERQEAAHNQVSPPPVKKRRVETDDDGLQHMGSETEAYQYTVCHALELEGAIGLNTPAGYSEIALQVPGIIVGTFLSSELGVEELIAVDVEIDTNILASMVEKSCRFVIRTSVEKVFQDSEEEEVETTEVQKTPTREQPSSPSLSSRTANGHTTSVMLSGTAPPPALVTPRVSGSSDFADDHHTASNAEPILMPIPDDLDERKEPRRISPQHGLNSFPFTPRTQTQGIMSQPSMVSPPPRRLDFEGSGFYLAPKKSSDSAAKASKPSLNVLVEVAGACMAVN